MLNSKATLTRDHSRSTKLFKFGRNGIIKNKIILHKISKNVFVLVLAIFVHKGVKNAINCAREGRLKPLKLQEGQFNVIPR